MKLVADTNILISGSLWDGPAAQLLDAVEHGKATLLSSPDLLAEEVTIVSPAVLSMPPELRDPKDLPVLACAVAAQADAIVSGDKDLLTLRSFQGIAIITVRDALHRLGLAGE